MMMMMMMSEMMKANADLIRITDIVFLSAFTSILE